MKAAYRAIVLGSISSLVVAGAPLIACVGDVPVASRGNDGGTDAGNDGTDAAKDGTNGGSADGSPGALQDGESPGDGSSGSDGSPGVDASVEACVAASSCSGSTLHTCNGDTACSLGCVSYPLAHCGVFNPTGDVGPGDFAIAGVTDVTLMGMAFLSTINVDTGEIKTFGGTILRAANANPALQEVNTGIGFRRTAGKIGVFQFKSLTLTGGPFVVVGGVPVAFVAETTIDLQSELRVQDCGPTGGAGGGSGGGSVAQNGGGLGGGAHGTGDVADNGSAQLGAGGGGGYFASGGAGGAGTGQAGAPNSGASGGPAFGNQTSFDPLVGGSGGGGAKGGNGGGAVLVAAGKTVTVGGSASTFGGVNAGGCGAASGGGANMWTLGGGGSGGTILIEAPSVLLAVQGVLASNGGSGASAFSDGSFTFNGSFNANPSAPYPSSASTPCVGSLGVGGAGATVAGSAGLAAPGLCSAQAQRKWGGGGGGSVGRIRVLTTSGTVTPAGSFVFSPTLATNAATVGTIAVE